MIYARIVAHVLPLHWERHRSGAVDPIPERELRSAVAAMSQAIEQREPATFLDSISDDFARESGAFASRM